MPASDFPGSSPEHSRKSTSTDLAAGAGEVAQLLAVSRRLADVDSTDGLVRAVADAIGNIVPHRAVALVPGGELPAPAVAGGESLTAAAREVFAKQVADAAGTNGIPVGALAWASPVADDGVAPVPAGAPLLMPLGRRGGRAGLLVVLPDRLSAAGESVHRLLGGVAQQAAQVADRLERTGTTHDRRLQELLDGLDTGILFLDGESRLLRANREARRLLASIHGAEVATDASLAELGLPVAHAVGDGIEFCCRTDQRTYRMRLLSPEAGGPGERAACLHDISVERARQEQVRQAERLSALGEMLSGVAHELNNPLSTVTGYAQLLSRQTTDPALGDRLSIVAAEAERCRKIVQNLLDVARSRDNESRALSVNELVQSVVELFAYPLRVDDIELLWDPPPHLPLIRGDRHALQQVLVNLVGNAHHAMRGRPSPRRLTLAVRATGSRVVVEVGDTGPGIPAAHVDRIFEPFFTTKEPGVGTGLGLSLARRTMRQHDGHLSVRSDPGAGATLVLDLAAMKDATVTASDEAPRHAPTGRRILVVDDEESFRLLLAETLGGADNEVLTAADGAAALALLENENVDLVLSDLRMPCMGGRELWARLAEEHTALSRSFLLMTGDVLTGEMQSFLARHDLVCLRKPFGLDELERVIASVLARAGSGPDPVVDSAGDSDEIAPRID